MKFIYSMLIPILGFSTVSAHATPASTDGPKMTITTSRKIGTELSYFYTVNSDDAWIDLNNNGQFDQGEKLLNDVDEATYTIQSQTLNIYGSVTTFMPSYMDLTAIDVSGNPDLEFLDCSNNNLTTLDVSKNTNLNTLWCYKNQLTSLNLTGLTKLESLNCSNNKLNSLILDNCPNLETLTLKVNELPGNVTKAIIAQIPSRTGKKGKLNAIDTQNSKDKNVFYKSDIAAAKAKNWKVTDSNNGEPIEYDGVEESATPSSQYAPIDGSKISIYSSAKIGSQLDVYVEFSDGPTPWIDLNGNGQCDGNEEILQNGVDLTPKLTNADMTIYGKIKVLDLSDIAALWDLSTIDISHCPELEQLQLGGNQLTSIDCSANPNLKILGLSRNQLTSIDLSHNTNLSTISLDDNKIASITLSSLPNLLNIYVQGNKLGKEEMQKIINSLPDRTGNERKGELIVLDLKKTDEGNVCTKDQVAQAKAKNWMVESKEGRTIAPYEGSEDTPAVHYAPVDGPMIMLSFSEVSKPITINSSTADDNANLIAWADLNGNGHFDEGEALVNGKNKITIDNKSVTLYGNFTKFEAKKANITAIDPTKATALDTLNLYKNALTDLDLSQNVNLKNLDVVSNALTALDLSHNSELTSLNCAMNKLTVLNLSQNAKLINLSAYKNELTSILLNATVNSELNKVVINSNKIKASEMTKIITNLPQRTAQDGAMLIVINTKDKSEGNVCITKDVATAKGKNWMVKDFNGSIKNMIDYEGSKDPAGIKTIAQAQVNVYPTYVHDQFTVEVPADYANGNLNLYDLNGRLLLSAQINGTKTQMSIRNLPNGIYLVKVGEVVKRIVKQ